MAARNPRTWRQDPEGRRARILSATEQEIIAKGFRGVRTINIARRARVSEGTIFNLFGTKDELLAEVGRRYGEGLVAAAFRDVERDDPDLDMAPVVRNIFAFVRENAPLLSAFLWMNDPDRGGPAADALRREIVTAIDQVLKNRAARPGQTPTTDTRIAAELRFNLVEGALRDCFVRHQGRKQNAYQRELIRILQALW